MADTGTSDAGAAVGGGESREANLNVEGGSESHFAISVAETSDVAEPAAAEIADKNQADASTSMPSSSSLLPAALVGSILNFMPYKEVRTALLAGKFRPASSPSRSTPSTFCALRSSCQWRKFWPFSGKEQNIRAKIDDDRSIAKEARRRL